jgi:hypothetical protein
VRNQGESGSLQLRLHDAVTSAPSCTVARIGHPDLQSRLLQNRPIAAIFLNAARIGAH